MQLNIKLFGKTKELEPSGSVVLSFEKDISVIDLKTALIEKFSANADPKKVSDLIQDCALGNSRQILRNEDLLTGNESLVLLPPVCGG